MLRSLRNRLILSHILPLLIIIPFTGVGLISVLETQYFLPQLRDDLLGVASLLAEVTGDQPSLWDNTREAQSILESLEPRLATRVMLIAPDGRLIASSDPADKNRLGQVLQFSGLAQAQQGHPVEQTIYSQNFRGEVLDVLHPVYSSQGQLVGIIRMSYHFASIPQDILRLRYLIAVILSVALLSGSILGSLLALNLSRPLRRVTRSIYALARGSRRDPLPVSGPDEIKTLVQAINYLNERLHDMEQSRRQLLANLVHELGRPLGAFHSGLQALTRGARQDPQLMDELLQGMDEEVSQLRRLLDDLSHLHDQVLGSLELDRRPIEFGKWLSQTVRPWQELARQQHLRWETSIPADLPVVEADPDRMGQVVGNLVNNAIKYTPSRGKVSISAGETPDRMVWLEVHDTGPGISPQEQDKIFEPFFRGEQKKRIKQGLGLGLSIARDLVIAHGGRIDIDSEPGLGTSFIVKIPISSDEMGPVNGSGQGVSA